MAKENKGAIIKMPSGEMRYVPLNCRATVGELGNKVVKVSPRSVWQVLSLLGVSRHSDTRPARRRKRLISSLSSA